MNTYDQTKTQLYPVTSTTCEPQLLRKAEYHCAAHHRRDWMEDTGAEVAFAGRSNVGKSSAINAITSRKALARTSKTPGRTQQIIFFTLDTHFRLVDLPGYGYAKVPAALQQHWEKIVQRYLEERVSLRALILPVDCRREPTVPGPPWAPGDVWGAGRGARARPVPLRATSQAGPLPLAWGPYCIRSSK